jgi:UDP:flavonoid glycosyltransferase YjiC (YdhE family)
MLLFPLHSEQRIVADRVAELGAGVKLKASRPKYLAKAVADLIEHQTFLENV